MMFSFTYDDVATWPTVLLLGYVMIGKDVLLWG
jgi:hypothetical protein